MATTGSSTPPDFGPVPDEMLRAPRYPDDPQFQRHSWESSQLHIYNLLRLLNRSDLAEGFAPYTWGFTIYRAVFPGDGCSDERFAAGVRRLESWVRFHARQSYYGISPYHDPWKYHPQWRPEPGTMHFSNRAVDEWTRRLWNEVVEDYPGKERVRGGGEGVEEGDEDFLPAAEAFVAWNESLGYPFERHAPDNVNQRHDFCLLIDERALHTLESLPAEVPEARPRTAEEGDALRRQTGDAWVWVIGRERAKLWSARKTDPDNNPIPEMRGGGAMSLRPDETPAPPWLRIPLSEIESLWYTRPSHYLRLVWHDAAVREPRRPDTVFWYGSGGMTVVEFLRERKERARREAMEIAEGAGQMSLTGGASTEED